MFNNKNMPAARDIILEAVEIKEEKIEQVKFELPEYCRIISVEAYSRELMEKFKDIDTEFNKNN